MTTASTTTRTIKYFDKTELLIAARWARQLDYNRQLNLDWLAENLNDEDYFPISFSMLHEHAGGIKVAPHVRCMIVLNEAGDTAMLDVTMDIYNRLNTAELEVPDRD